MKSQLFILALSGKLEAQFDFNNYDFDTEALREYLEAAGTSYGEILDFFISESVKRQLVTWLKGWLYTSSFFSIWAGKTKKTIELSTN